jgi:hypothetical protein
MANRNVPNDASAKGKAEGDRWASDSETVERADRAGGTENKGSGISNRPIGEEIDNQASLPEPREVRDGANAGRGKNGEEHSR